MVAVIEYGTSESLFPFISVTVITAPTVPMPSSADGVLFDSTRVVSAPQYGTGSVHTMVEDSFPLQIG